MKLLFCFGIAAANRYRRSVWGYSEQGGDWTDEMCSGEHQSPIAINHNGDLEHLKLEPFVRTNYDAAATWKLKNNGHTVQMTAPPSNNMRIAGGALDGNYTLAQFHFHWGSADHAGSEHLLNAKQFYSEMHLVHYKTEYGDLASSLLKPDGLAVLGFLIDTADDATDGPLDNFIRQKIAMNVEDSAVEYEIADFSMNQVLPAEFKDFYRYEGSLTTPTCNEAVVWTIFSDPIVITTETMEFMSTFSKNDVGETLVNNFRDVQPLNDRTVKLYSISMDDHDHDDHDDGHENETEETDSTSDADENDSDEKTDPEPEPEGSSTSTTTFATFAAVAVASLVHLL